MTIAIKRVYEPPSEADRSRILVDRLWPRGLTKEQAKVDEWLRDLAPSNELRRWYHTHTEQWPSFRSKYLKELTQPGYQESLQRLYELARKKKRLTLLYASKNETRNNAAVLKELLDGVRKPPKGTGPAGAYGARERKSAIRRR
ncbi:MAG TPA: DUF488 family protein [Candidatus Acidoferrum sp.]|jgi:uncharacterized protein YeaO (DUF488 family)|nr:DUF488 family protein [Candidatus Acidoferrum sp.]